MKFLFVYVMIMFSIYACCGGSCVLKLNEHLPKPYEPLFLTNDMRFLFPKKQKDGVAVVLSKDEGILIACPGPSNEVIHTHQLVSSAVCQSGNRFLVNSRVLRSEELGCRKRPKPSLKIIRSQCAVGKGDSIEVGYQVEGRWLPLFEVCHNIPTGETYYSHHVLRGSLIQGKETGCPRPGFSRGDKSLYPGYGPNEAYLQVNQRSVLTKLVGGRRAQELLDQTTLSRGHLAPDADFLFATHQALTYFYVNAAPQWQTINQNNWYIVEDSVRKLAAKLDVELEVVTGTYGVLKIQGSTRSLHETRLHDRSLPVPEYLWKVVRNTKDDSCIVLVVTNDPFSKVPRYQSPCTGDCHRYQLASIKKDHKLGTVYCCEYLYLKMAVPYLPQLTCKKPLFFQ